MSCEICGKECDERFEVTIQGAQVSACTSCEARAKKAALTTLADSHLSEAARIESIAYDLLTLASAMRGAAYFNESYVRQAERLKSVLKLTNSLEQALKVDNELIAKLRAERIGEAA